MCTAGNIYFTAIVLIRGNQMKKSICILLLLSIVISLTGCWSRREPKNLALVISALYELNDEGSIKATTEIINPEAQGGPQGGGGDKSPTLTISGEGKTLPEALRMTSVTLERNLFAGQTLARFYSEKLAQRDIMSVQDYFLRDVLTDENPLVIVVKGDKPELVYETTLGLSDTVGNYIDSLHQTQDNFISTAVFIDTLSFVKEYYEEGKQPVAGLLEIVEDPSKASKNNEQGGSKGGAKESKGGAEGADGSDGKKCKIKYEGLAAFKNEKLVGYMDGMEARAYKIMTNLIRNSIQSIPDDSGGFTALKINSSKAKLKADEYEGKIKLGIDIKMDVSIMQAGNNVDVNSPKALKSISGRLNKQIENDVSAAIKKAQEEFKSDIFGFGTAMHHSHPAKWKKIKGNWDDLFSQAEFKINAESSISRSGQIKKSVDMDA